MTGTCSLSLSGTGFGSDAASAPAPSAARSREKAKARGFMTVLRTPEMWTRIAAPPGHGNSRLFSASLVETRAPPEGRVHHLEGLRGQVVCGQFRG